MNSTGRRQTAYAGPSIGFGAQSFWYHSPPASPYAVSSRGVSRIFSCGRGMLWCTRVALPKAVWWWWCCCWCCPPWNG